MHTHGGRRRLYADRVTATTYAPTPQDRAAFDLIEHPPQGGTALRFDDATGATLAKGDPDLVKGIAVLKAGTFHGSNGPVTLDDVDLEGYAERFEALRSFVRPPLRADHSYSVMSVLGRFESLRVETRPDDTVGGREVPMLVGDVRLVGSTEDKRQTRERILSGMFQERSSELFPYRTNTGVEYSSAFLGAAFVDIPAVEGLGAITLRRGHALTSDHPTDEEAAIVADEQTPDETTTPTTPVEDQVVGDPTPVTSAPPAGETTPDAPVEDDEPALEVDTDEDTPEDDPEVDAAPPGEVPPANLRAALAAAGVTDPATMLRVEQEVERRATLRVEQETRLGEFRAAGILTPKVAPHAEVLLRHDDEGVRDAAYAILSATRPAVALRSEKRGTHTSVAPGGARDGQVITLSMTRDEVASVWESLDTDARKVHRSEYTEWQRAQAAQ